MKTLSSLLLVLLLSIPAAWAGSVDGKHLICSRSSTYTFDDCKLPDGGLAYGCRFHYFSFIGGNTITYYSPEVDDWYTPATIERHFSKYHEQPTWIMWGHVVANDWWFVDRKTLELSLSTLNKPPGYKYPCKLVTQEEMDAALAHWIKVVQKIYDEGREELEREMKEEMKTNKM